MRWEIVLFVQGAKGKLAAQLEKAADAARDAEVAREEYHERLGAADRKVYALTKERDVLKREKEKSSGACSFVGLNSRMRQGTAACRSRWCRSRLWF